MENIPLYNSRIIDSYIKLIKKKYSHINVGDLLNHAEMQTYQVADQAHWFSQEQINRFQEKLSQLTNNVEIAREAGRFAASPETSGAMRQFALAMLGPANAYEMISKTVTNFTKSTTYRSKKLSTNKVEISVTPNPGVKEQVFQCENRMGYLEALAMIFGSKMPQVEHPECVFKGGSTCRYLISWEHRFSDTIKRIRNITAIALLPAVIGLIAYLPLHPWIALLSSYAFIVLILSFLSSIREKSELMTSLGNLRYSTNQLVDQININYNNALMTSEIGQAISSHTNSGSILLKFVQIFKKRLDYDRCMILMADTENKRLLYRAGYGYTEKQLKLLNSIAFSLDRPNAKGIFVVSFRDKKPFLINNVSEIEDDLSLKSLAFAKKLGSHSFICCPIIADDESIGLLAVDNIKSKRGLVQSDMSLLIGLASVLGISIRNADLLEARERQFRSILQVLAASIDARDPMTSGHSEKVTEFAMGICNELDLSDDYCEMIRVAALLHDYGKIGIPDTILKKPGKLTDEEYEIVKTHADKTKRILNQINFEGIFSQVPDVAGSHHEKIDGSGYPNRLTGENIPLGAKIIAVADFFEAITARRHYRGPIPLRKAFGMLQAESGKTFDPKIVNAFLRYYAKTRAGEPDYRVSMLG
jgi:HD-GYP domain-containing protein (c-di-GMP phosphodiesterase class II)